MLMIGFLAVAFLVLNASQLTFLSLGHTGSTYARNSGEPSQVVDDELEKDFIKEQKVTEAKIIKEKWDVENNIATVPVPQDVEESIPSESKSAGV